jgi:hypothetical protein
VNSQGIQQKRGEVIERTINVEMIVDAIICQNYFKRVVAPFLFEVLNDEYFSFGLKIRILEKVLPDSDRKKLQNLRRVNTIRNYFAHCNLFVISVGEDDGSIFDPRKPDRGVDLEELFEEFCSIEPSTTTYLAKKYKEMGGELHKEIPRGDCAG